MLRGLKQFQLPEIEEKILKLWRERRAFETSIKNRLGRPPFRFYEGPPTANGHPHLGHAETRAFKDLIPRYKTMRGFYVERKGGWDTHGLPVELEVEKKLGLKSKKDIEKYGIAAFNERCRESVWQYKSEWEEFTKRIGFWIDLENPYISYESVYIESLWWIISEVHKQKLLSRGHKVVPWCPRCGTALSSHEIAQGYETVDDMSVYVKFKLKKGQKINQGFATDDQTYILSWTTTPWTLPGNVALAVGKDIEYVSYTDKNGTYILSKDAFNKLGIQAVISNSIMKGQALVGLEYEPLFDIKPLKNKKSHRVYPADFVTITDGTGVVHTAVMYGEDDYQLGEKLGLPKHHTVDESGKFTSDVDGFEGMFVKAKETEEKIIARLTDSGRCLKTESYAHEYPFCWRCKTPLLYYARASWFIAMSKLRSKLIVSNEQINWVPAHIKAGRFGEWLKDVKDWNFSRERYWGTPLPIWTDETGEETLVVAGLADLDKYAPHRNTFYLIRHGEASHNLAGEADSTYGPQGARLTERGIEQVEKAAARLKAKKIKIIYASPLDRTQATAKIIAKTIGAKVITDERLAETNFGDFSGQPIAHYHAEFKDRAERNVKKVDGAETINDVRRRVKSFIDEINAAHQNENIAVVSHGDALWLFHSMASGVFDFSAKTISDFDCAEVRPVAVKNIPRNELGELDLHRPWIDEVVLKSPKSQKPLRRVKELADVWFDSGAMPFAEWHYPFENQKKIDTGEHFPADFISEAIDQTRGWFYTLLAVSTLLGKAAPYQNVICLGHLLDKNGHKMSKSKGNATSPAATIAKYGADALRWFFYTVNNPGDAKRFDERELVKISRRLFSIIYNSYIFYETTRAAVTAPPIKILDDWLRSKTAALINRVTERLDAYDIMSAAREIESFVDDLSRWYIRRSRRHFSAVVLKEALLALAKVMAPFTPFFAEALYQSLAGPRASVHLEDWPDAGPIDEALISKMAETRTAAGAGLAARETAGLKVRQPLRSLSLKSKTLASEPELIAILKDEVNVKEVIFDESLEAAIKLDVALTPELLEAGRLRDLMRAVQGLRRDAGLARNDKIALVVKNNPRVSAMAEANESELAKIAGVKKIESNETAKTDAALETAIGEEPLTLGIRKL